MKVAGFPCVEVDTTRRSHLRPIQTLDITNTIWHKILTGGNIDEVDEFLSIHQHFLHQNFLLLPFAC